MRSRYAPAIATLVTGGLRLGMITARANCLAANGATLASCAPSRRCRCQSSGRVIVSVDMMARRSKGLTGYTQLAVPSAARARRFRRCAASLHQLLLEQELQRVAHAKSGDVRRHVRQSAAAIARR